MSFFWLHYNENNYALAVSINDNTITIPSLESFQVVGRNNSMMRRWENYMFRYDKTTEILSNVMLSNVVLTKEGPNMYFLIYGRFRLTAASSS